MWPGGSSFCLLRERRRKKRISKENGKEGNARQPEVGPATLLLLRVLWRSAGLLLLGSRRRQTVLGLVLGLVIPSLISIVLGLPTLLLLWNVGQILWSVDSVGRLLGLLLRLGVDQGGQEGLSGKWRIHSRLWVFL